MVEIRQKKGVLTGMFGDVLSPHEKGEVKGEMRDSLPLPTIIFNAIFFLMFLVIFLLFFYDVRV